MWDMCVRYLRRLPSELTDVEAEELLLLVDYHRQRMELEAG